MAFNQLREDTDQLQEEAKLYIESSLAYYKLWGFKVAMKSTTMIFKFTLILVCVSMALFFFSIATAFAIGSALDNFALGFLIVGGFYIIATILLLLIKENIAEGRILEKFSEIFFND